MASIKRRGACCFVPFVLGCVMGTSYRLNDGDSTDEIRDLVRGTWTWKNLVAVLGLFGGLVAPILGSLMTVLSWFSTRLWHGLSFRTAGTSFFVMAIPLLLLGAHCLDLLDKEKRRVPTPKHYARKHSEKE